MKKSIAILCFGLSIGFLIGIIKYQFANIDMTEIRVFINNWKSISLMLGFGLIGSILFDN